ncbi:MAG: hypothetical protein DWQ01_09750 [Planctomycetota bacterium]|nr:MAG: hypothetical protein DWQ01_09750 [Planctomycetota bacterium]
MTANKWDSTYLSSSSIASNSAHILLRRKNAMVPSHKSLSEVFGATVTINPDGGIYPCCHTAQREFLLGSINQNNVSVRSRHVLPKLWPDSA